MNRREFSIALGGVLGATFIDQSAMLHTASKPSNIAIPNDFMISQIRIASRNNYDTMARLIICGKEYMNIALRPRAFYTHGMPFGSQWFAPSHTKFELVGDEGTMIIFDGLERDANDRITPMVYWLSV